MEIGDVGGVVAGLADQNPVEVLRRRVALAPGRVLLRAPLILLVAVVQEVVDHAPPGGVLDLSQVRMCVVPALLVRGHN